MSTVRNAEALNDFNVLILCIGLALVLIVVVLSFREWRLRQNKKTGSQHSVNDRTHRSV